MQDNDQVREQVRTAYARVARGADGCSVGCCGNQGSGGGFDCFLAAKRVGRTGHVIGVDMTPEMVTRARANARRVGTANVEFRRGP